MKGHPKGLLVLALTNMGERFGYYTMLAILVLYIKAKFGLSSSSASLIYGIFLALVYFLPLIGGFVADKILGYGKTIIAGVVVMFAGYALLAIPSEPNMTGKIMMYGALFLIAMGTGFFKGNLQALVGNLYESDLYKGKRDIAFSIFYMFINIGAFFAPSVANSINNAFLRNENFTYDASIPNNYVKLNDFKTLTVLDLSEEDAFKTKVYSSHQDLTTKKDSAAVLEKAKKTEKVLFKSEETNYLFNLKAAGLAQLTASESIKDSAKRLSKKEYQLLDSRDPKDKEAIDVLKERIKGIQITDRKLYGDPNDPDKFPVNFAQNYVDKSLSKSYNMAFGVACISLIISLLIFLLFRKTWKHIDKTHKQQIREGSSDVVILTKAQVKERMIALFLVFFVVIFFWMSFHQNGACMTIFAQNYTASEISPLHNMMFSLLSIILFIVVVYGIYIASMGLFGGKKRPVQGLLITLLGLAGMVAFYFSNVKGVIESIKITPQIFQQFNPLFIVILTPVSVALFSYLANRKKEPSAPRKIGYGMLIAAIGFVILLAGSFGLPAPYEIGDGLSDVLVSPNWLISTYFVLTLAELFLSPMGLSFVAKVAPPQYKGMMQGGWLAATAIGNFMVGIMGMFWEKLQLYAFWGVLVICCLLSAAFIFSIMKRLEKATQ
ncbi:MAG: oligopeptide:H+ symporter [Prevotellaceae bacterium]|jgi:POT family proton-dependent oligopeptide transporter|nr:oligopeptide:H+ symporter [Prevotellaceae bacterium]